MSTTATQHPPQAMWQRWLQAGLLLFAVVALGWVAWGWLDAALYQQRQERLLAAALAEPSERADVGERGGATELATSRSLAPASIARTAPTARTAAVTTGEGDALGRIEIPRVGLAVMIADGDDAHTLRRAVGHIPGTGVLGGDGNAGIAGHRDSFFRPLKDVRIGDEVVITTPAATSRYRVEWAEVMSPDDSSALLPTDYPALTLVTCHPFYYVGNAPDRYVVRARLMESRASTFPDATTPLLAGGR